MTTTDSIVLCEAEHCAIPHEDLFTYVDGAWCAQAFSPTPREHSKGHESLLLCRTADEVTISAEFGDARAAVVLPVDVFDRIVRQSREGWHGRTESAEQVIIEWHEAKAEAIGQHARQYRREGKDDIALRMEAVAATHANSASNLKRGEHRA